MSYKSKNLVNHILYTFLMKSLFLTLSPSFSTWLIICHTLHIVFFFVFSQTNKFWFTTLYTEHTTSKLAIICAINVAFLLVGFDSWLSLQNIYQTGTEYPWTTTVHAVMGQFCCKKSGYRAREDSDVSDVNVPTVSTPKAVLSLLIIFAVYVGVQVVSLAYPVLFPAGA